VLGLGESGQRGDRSFRNVSVVPVTVSGITGATRRRAGYGTRVRHPRNGTMHCWARKSKGSSETGPPPIGYCNKPVAVERHQRATAIFSTTGDISHLCVAGKRQVRCWGSEAGQGQPRRRTFTEGGGSAAPVPGERPHEVAGLSAAAARRTHMRRVSDGNGAVLGG